jgi:uncharacterized phage-like protein YoqJ
MKPVTVAFTGHRPEKLGGYGRVNPKRDAIQTLIEHQLKTIKPVKAITGMALGVDQWAAEVCYELGIPYIAAVPFKGQDKIWPEESKKHYQWLLQKAEDIYVISPGGYAAWKMQKRNEWMVDNSNLLLAVWDGTPGGTGKCIEYAEKTGRKIVRLNPHPAGFAADYQR